MWLPGSCVIKIPDGGPWLPVHSPDRSHASVSTVGSAASAGAKPAPVPLVPSPHQPLLGPVNVAALAQPPICEAAGSRLVPRPLHPSALGLGCRNARPETKVVLLEMVTLSSMLPERSETLMGTMLPGSVAAAPAGSSKLSGRSSSDTIWARQQMP